jgi:hypothetical protein
MPRGLLLAFQAAQRPQLDTAQRMGSRDAALEPGDVKQTAREIDLTPFEPAKLADAQAMTVGDQDHRGIAMAVATAFARRSHQHVDLGRCQVFAWPAIDVALTPWRPWQFTDQQHLLQQAWRHWGSARWHSAKAGADRGHGRGAQALGRAPAGGQSAVSVWCALSRLAPLEQGPKVRKAQRLIEARMAERSHQVAAAPEAGPAEPGRRLWAELSKGEKLAATTDRALDVVKTYLDLPVDPSNAKLAAMQATLALGVIGYQIRVESAALTDRSEKPADPPPQISVHFVGPDSAPESAPEKVTTRLPRIVTMAEYEALASGRRFLAADGSERIKP